VASGAEELPPRLFGTDADVRRIADGLITRTLPRADWTHEAHLAAIAAILLDYPQVRPEADMPGIISGYNVAVGGVNDDTQGYHETITQFWVANARAFLAGDAGGALVQRVNRFIAAPEGRREAPLRYFSRARLFSVEARRRAVEPDLMRFEWNMPDAAPAPQL
jgi:hypothetical protein